MGYRLAFIAFLTVLAMGCSNRVAHVPSCSADEPEYLCRGGSGGLSETPYLDCGPAEPGMRWIAVCGDDWIFYCEDPVTGHGGPQVESCGFCFDHPDTGVTTQGCLLGGQPHCISVPDPCVDTVFGPTASAD